MNKKKLTALFMGMTMLLSTSALTAFAEDTNAETGTAVQSSVEAEHHASEAEWIYDQNYHWHSCTDEGCTERVDFAHHNYKWIVTKPATETEEGWMFQGCDCGYMANSAMRKIPVISDAPVFSADSAVYTNGDIVLDVDAKGGKIAQMELVFSMKTSAPIGTATVPYEANVDPNGKGTFTFKQSEFEKFLSQYSEKLENVTNISFLAIFSYDTDEAEGVEQVSAKTTSVDVTFAAQESSITIAEAASGVSMVLPGKEADNFTLSVTVSDGKNGQSAVQNAVGKVVTVADDKIRTYDLSLLKDGEPFTYNGQFRSTVSLPIPQGWNISQLALFYFNESTGEAVPVGFTVDKDRSLVLFETDHFSKYVLVQKSVASGAEETVKPEGTGNTDDGDKAGDKVKPVAVNDQKNNKVVTAVKTGDSSNILFWGVAAVISLAGVMAALVLKRR